jgi:hypothetical protein
MRDSLRPDAAAQYRAPHAAGDDVDQLAGEDDPLQAIAHFTDGAPSAGEMALLRKGFDAYLNAGGEIPLERCLGIAATHGARRRLKRDTWLRKAAMLIDAGSSWARSQKLEAEWNRFISRGAWQAWRADDHPPPEATPLSEALFYATMCNRSDSLTAKQIERITGHIFTGKCR